ncbi:MAG TPA: hypothetical protein VK458_21705 [Myxococcaceae bacterium]|nr:hypothetical protein [Myxococcaceae bacterium]
MKELTYTLVADGPSDKCLERIINWTLGSASSRQGTLLINPQFADYRDDPAPPRGLVDKLYRASQDFPCDILFIHRDAEREDPEHRRSEILNAATQVGLKSIVCIIPIRMTEAWLLFNEFAIRQAAGNPNGKTRLKLPAITRIEALPDPKAVLYSALEVASEATGRRLKQFQRDLPMLKLRIAEQIEDFSQLRALSAFNNFEGEVRAVLAHLGLLQL